MAGIYSQFETNKDLERTGIRIEYHDENDVDGKPATFLIARAGGSNIAYQKALDRETRHLRRALATDNVSMDTMNRINRKVFIETCLLGWENMTGKDGKELVLTKANAETLFTDLPDLYNDLVRQASTVGLYRASAEEDEKNS